VFVRTMRIVSSFARLNKVATSETLFPNIGECCLRLGPAIIKFVNTRLFFAGNKSFFCSHRRSPLLSMTLRDAISFILDVRVILGHNYICSVQSNSPIFQTAGAFIHSVFREQKQVIFRLSETWRLNYGYTCSEDSHVKLRT